MCSCFNSAQKSINANGKLYMQKREAAVYVTDTLLSVAKTLFSSIHEIESLKQEGKVSEREASDYRDNVIGYMDKLLDSVLIPVFETHPDLQPDCCICTAAEQEQS